MSSYLALRKRFQSKGFTLVEMMVVVALIGFLSAIAVSLISLLFQSNIRAAQSANQQNNIEVFYGFLASKLSYVDGEDMGLPVSSSSALSVVPASLSKNQMLFTFRDDLLNTTCYRIMYIKERQEIRVADYQGKSCFQALGSLGSNLRSPNDPLSGANTTSDGYATRNHPRFDPALDSASEEWSTTGLSPEQQEASSFALVSGVRDGSGYSDSDSDPRNNWPLSYPEGPGYNKTPLEIFSYWKQDSGSLGENPIARTTPLDISGIGSVKIQTFNSAASGLDQTAIVSDRFYEQRFYIGQLCPIPASGGGSATPTPDTGGDPLDNVLPAKSWKIGGASRGDAVNFGDVLFDSGETTGWSISGGDEINIPAGEGLGIYQITVNACFADNALDLGALEVRNGADVVLRGSSSFADLPADGRCLSLAKTLSFSTANLQVFVTEGSIISGDISVVWQSKDRG